MDVVIYKAKAAPKMVPATPIAPTIAPAPMLAFPAALLEVVAEAAEPLAPLAPLDMLMDREAVMDPEVDMLWPDERAAGAELDAAATVAGSTEVVAGIYTLEEFMCSRKGTYRSGSLSDLDGKVVGGDEGSETGRVDVLADLECTKGSTSLGEVGGGRELGRLRVDQDDVSARLAHGLGFEAATYR